ncbi:DNA-binding response regulator [Actinoplanes philippinensis]|uniref:DNA-binding response regulator, NarL/FixJ family, contains REC and HTH domains n=1 Tax=Actinoplanes philippinensis TaxID=35752 RepID=A0A1I2N8S8_9ACTN|nr:response regulator transcription factor [Actinoplanes philippinensis]GIE76293.1 DNA-binding response regulator [Actinoplanes philippinensis]SFF98117.1 DNA-binding response regulator, NarL/FixJ family, contains REC and HTH domains [Actinoplanes philippinensis]
MTTVRVLLADDHEFFRSGFRNALETQSDLECVGDVGDGQAAVEAVGRLRPDVAVLDVRMPRLDGLAAAEALRARGDTTRILLLTTYDEDSYVYRGLRAGASGFCLKNMPTEELLNAVRVVARGDALIDPSVTRRLVSRFADAMAPAATPAPPDLDRLTEREREVLLEVARGHSNAEIAARLYVGEQTVKTHVSHVLTKLSLRDRVQAVIYAYENSLL